MLDLKDESTRLNGVIQNLIDATQKEYEVTQARVNELSILLQDKEMRTDRRENADFQIATDERDVKNTIATMLLKRINSLQSELGEYNSTGFITVGSTVALKVDSIDGKSPNIEQTDFIVKLVKHETSKATEGLLAIDSKVGVAIIGRTTGDEVAVSAPIGNIVYKIEGVY